MGSPPPQTINYYYYYFYYYYYHHHGLSASAATNTLLTHPIIKEFEGADWGIRKPRSNQLRLLSLAAGAMIAQFLAEGPI